MTTAITPIDTSRAVLARAATVLADRAAAHCQSSTLANDVLAQAYRRRAAELELAAWVGAVKAGSAAEPGSIACVA